MTILLDTPRVVAVHKPAGQLVIPGRGPSSGPTLQQEVEAQLNLKLWVVHRLDGAASGVVLFAKDAEAHKDLNRAFETRAVEKKYIAAVQGIVDRDGGIRSAIKQFGSGRMGVHKHGLASHTEFHVLKRMSSASLLDVSIETGRRHQIRVHLYSIGHPILGDPLYGEDRPIGGLNRLMLHAVSIAVDTLSTGKLSVRCEPDDEFQRLLGEIKSTRNAGEHATD